MDGEEKLWIGTWNGYPYLYDTKTKRLDSCLFVDISNRTLSSKRISCTITDNEGNLWVGTAKGVSIFHPHYNIFDVFTINESGITRNDVKILHLYPESDSIAWLGTSNGLYYYNMNTHERLNFLPGKICSSSNFYYITPKNKNELWIG